MLHPSDAPNIYDEVAEAYSEHVASSLWNAHYDRPAVLSLLPDVEGKAVLDAGCGPGLYAQELARRGADVVAIDASTRMVELATERLGASHTVRLHDLTTPLHFADDESFDVVLSALVWHYLERRTAALNEFHRVLRPDGCIVLSTHHPFDDWLRHGGDYFDVRPVVDHWSSLDTTFPTWRMPLTVLCGEFADAGFVIERLLEPQPSSSAKDLDPDEHERLSTRPGFVAFRLGKGSWLA